MRAKGLESADALGREKYLKSGAGRRFLQMQLRHYLRKHPLRGPATCAKRVERAELLRGADPQAKFPQEGPDDGRHGRAANQERIASN